jgi:hypothetical protein
LPFKHFGVMNVIAPQSGAQRGKIMKTFTINADNNITVHTSKKAARETGAPAFASEAEFADLIGTDNKRLVAIWNSIPGVTPVTKFANRKAATQRIWTAIQSLGESAAAPAQQSEDLATPEAAPASEVAAEASSEPEPNPAAESAQTDTALPAEVSKPAAQAEPEPPVASAETVATPGAQGVDVAPPAADSGKKATRAKRAPKASPKAPAAKTDGAPREGSKTAQVVAMLKREGGATLAEIMATFSWQKHTVRGFMAGAMKKAGYTVESFKPEGGERTYRINK